MQTLAADDLARFEAALRERHQALAAQIALAAEGKQDEIDRYHDVGLHDQGEVSAEEQVLDNATAVIGHLQAELADVGAALKRVENGDYGYCRDCGNEIPFGRLEAQLHAARCVTCQAQADEGA